MPTFDTPEPITVTVELGAGDIRVVASERATTLVEVRPTDAAKASDVTAADQTRVEYANGALLIRAPRGWRQYGFRNAAESIDVHVEVPAGSQVRGGAGIATLHSAGRLGECRFKTGIGDIRVDHAGPMELSTGSGDVSVGRAAGHASVTTGSGAVRIGSIEGTAVIKNSNGDTWVGAVAGDLRVSAANGTIVVDRAQATVAAKTANGDVRLGEVTHGAIVAHTARGSVDIGIGDGVAAWLDLNTSHGNVQSDLDVAAAPGPGENAVQVSGRTSFGDITIRRSPVGNTGNPSHA